MLLMKDMIDFFKCTLDDGAHNVSNHAPEILEDNSENGCCVDQTALEHNLHVRRAIRRK